MIELALLAGAALCLRRCGLGLLHELALTVSRPAGLPPRTRCRCCRRVVAGRQGCPMSGRETICVHCFIGCTDSCYVPDWEREAA